MNLPSIRTLETAFPGKGRILRALIESPAVVCAHPAAVALSQQSHGRPTLAHQRMTALNAELEFFGVENVPSGRRSPGFEYLNSGDTYAVTIIRFHNGRYRVTDIGSIIEHGNYE